MKLTNLTDDSKEPLKSEKNDVRVISCKDFKGSLSSITGIQSKFLYIGKISELSGEPSSPTVRIVCEPECISECKYLHKKTEILAS